jgi:hypothetical protein
VVTGSAEAGVAATDDTDGAVAAHPSGSIGALFAAALALQGMTPNTVLAQTAPDQGLVAVKYLDYRDWQPGADRIRVKSPSLYVLAPLSDTLAAEGSLVYDSVSGASPLYYNTLSGASGVGITEYRTAGNARLTKYLGQIAIGAGAAVSSERDYLARAVSADVRVASDDRNRTYAFGIAGSSDRINSTNGVAEGQERHAIDILAGITQALSADAIVESNVTYSSGHGYYSDPYKALDIRPDHRRIFAWLTRYNQYVASVDATLKLSYRFLHDSFGGKSQTVEMSWYQPLPSQWSVMPNIRYYSQGSADFYFNPPFSEGYVPGQLYTADTRLSALGAMTAGMTVAKRLGGGWTVDLSYQFYRQRSSWHLGGGGSPGLEPFSASWIEAGISKTF